MKFSKVSDKKAQEFRHIYIYSIVNVTSAAFIAPIPKSSHFNQVRYQQRQSAGINDVHVFNTELAMYYRAIFNCACFRLFYERRETLICSCVLVNISRNKSKTGPEWQFFFCLISCVNDFLIDFLRRLRSPDRLDGNESSMFRHPLGLLEENFSRPDS